MKRMVIVLLLSALFIISCSLTAFAATVADNPAGTIVDSISSGDEMEKNSGVVKENEGTINQNIGIVETNEGTITENSGTIQDNDGEVKDNTGKITVNDEKVESNSGLITENTGTVISNYGSAGKGIHINEGNVTNNFGEVTDNMLTGVVDLGSVEKESIQYTGEVVNNYGKVNNARLNDYNVLVYSAAGNTYLGITYMNGTEELYNESVKENDTVTVKEFNISNYESFSHWLGTYSNGSTIKYYTGDSFLLSDPLMLTAIWKEINYNIIEPSENKPVNSKYPSSYGSEDNPLTEGQWKESIQSGWTYVYKGSALCNTVAWIKYTDKDGKEIIAKYYFDSSSKMVTDKTVEVKEGVYERYGSDGKLTENATDNIENVVDLKAAVVNGGEFKLTKDITMEEKLVIKKDSAIDGNGYTLNLNGGAETAEDSKLAVSNISITYEGGSAKKYSKDEWLTYN